MADVVPTFRVGGETFCLVICPILWATFWFEVVSGATVVYTLAWYRFSELSHSCRVGVLDNKRLRWNQCLEEAEPSFEATSRSLSRMVCWTVQPLWNPTHPVALLGHDLCHHTSVCFFQAATIIQLYLEAEVMR